MNAKGVFAALTNRPCAEPDPTRRSRGHVVVEALAAPSAELAAKQLASIPPDLHNPFNAFVSDGERAFALVYEGSGSLQELAPGTHVIAHADPHERAKAQIARQLPRAAPR